MGDMFFPAENMPEDRYGIFYHSVHVVGMYLHIPIGSVFVLEKIAVVIGLVYMASAAVVIQGDCRRLEIRGFLQHLYVPVCDCIVEQLLSDVHRIEEMQVFLL